MKQIGSIIYSYRKVNGLSQEELAGIVGVSSAAVSKWERDISVPDVEVLCRLADYFEITVDELLGRTLEDQAEVKFDDRADADRFCMAAELLECCALARNQGLFAMEERVKKKEGGVYEFLKFAVRFLMDGLQKQMTPADIREFLLRYAESERDCRTAKIVSEGLTLIISGENEEILREVLRSFLGRKYARMFAVQEQEKRRHMNRDEMIGYYSEVSVNVPDTGLLDGLGKMDDERLQRMLRSISNEDFVRAVAGASVEIRRCLFRNLSDRLIWMLGEGLVNFAEGSEEVREAQRKVLELVGE